MPGSNATAQGPLLELLLEKSPLAVIEWSTADYRIVRWTGEAARIFGWTAEEAVGQTIDELDWIHPEDRARVEQLIADMCTGRSPRNVSRNRNLRKDGAVIHCEWHNSTLGEARGGFSVLSLVLDVTDQRRSEQELRESEARAQRHAAELQAVLDTVPAAVWIARDPAADHIDANRFGAELLRRPRGANVSVAAPAGPGMQAFRVLMDGVEVPAEALPIQAAARSGRESRGAETEVRFEDGTVRYLLGNATPVLDEQGRPVGSVGAFIDISERKLAEHALREADQRKNRFLAVLSHELRNPLAPIRNSIYLLERAAPGSEAARRALEVLRRQADHMARLVDDLLDISRITHGLIELQLARLDVRDVVRRAWTDARGLFEQRGVDLLLAEPGGPLWVDADAARLAQLVGNLLNNALKFTPPGGQVRVGAERRVDHCEISVSDTGTGIEPAELERIFEPFVQSAGTPLGLGGMGIGLALVRELAGRLGGRVRAESGGLGRGARFLVDLPLVPAPAAAGPAYDPRPAAAGLSVLIVEDNEDAAASLADLLAFTGHRSETAGCGRAGVEAATARPPDVLICDVGLPDMSGHEVIRAIRAAPEGARIFALALTGYAQPEDRAAALAAGFDAHLPKPPSLDELEGLLAEVARRRGATA